MTRSVEDMVTYETRAGRAYVTLRRAEKRNALTYEMFDRIMDLVGQAEADDDVKVVIFRAEGGDFCTGHDLAQVGSEYGFDPSGKGRRPSQRARLQFRQAPRRAVPQPVLLHQADAGADPGALRRRRAAFGGGDRPCHRRRGREDRASRAESGARRRRLHDELADPGARPAQGARAAAARRDDQRHGGGAARPHQQGRARVRTRSRRRGLGRKDRAAATRRDRHRQGGNPPCARFTRP